MRNVQDKIVLPEHIRRKVAEIIAEALINLELEVDQGEQRASGE